MACRPATSCRLTRHLSAQTGARAAYFLYAATGREDFNGSGSAGLTYAFTPWCSVGATASGTLDRSSRAVFDYNVLNSGASVFFRLRFLTSSLPAMTTHLPMLRRRPFLALIDDPDSRRPERECVPACVADGLKSAQVSRIFNDVRLLSENQPARPAVVSDSVSGKAAVQTGAASRAELTFSDQTLTRLGANSYFSFVNGTRDMNPEQRHDAASGAQGCGPRDDPYRGGDGGHHGHDA